MPGFPPNPKIFSQIIVLFLKYLQNRNGMSQPDSSTNAHRKDAHQAGALVPLIELKSLMLQKILEFD